MLCVLKCIRNCRGHETHIHLHIHTWLQKESTGERERTREVERREWTNKQTREEKNMRTTTTATKPKPVWSCTMNYVVEFNLWKCFINNLSCSRWVCVCAFDAMHKLFSLCVLYQKHVVQTLPNTIYPNYVVVAFFRVRILCIGNFYPAQMLCIRQ